jgi:hypothetical protein
MFMDKEILAAISSGAKVVNNQEKGIFEIFIGGTKSGLTITKDEVESLVKEGKLFQDDPHVVCSQCGRLVLDDAMAWIKHQSIFHPKVRKSFVGLDQLPRLKNNRNPNQK